MLKLLLLLIDYSESEVDLIGLFEIWLHPHDLGECLLGVLKRAISIIQDANAVPQLGLLDLVSPIDIKLDLCDLPSGLGDSTGLVDMQCKLLEDCPSSDSNVLWQSEKES